MQVEEIQRIQDYYLNLCEYYRVFKVNMNYAERNKILEEMNSLLYFFIGFETAKQLYEKQ